MVRMALSEFQERMEVGRKMLKEAYPENPAVDQIIEAIDIAVQVLVHMSIPFQRELEEKLDINR